MSSSSSAPVPANDVTHDVVVEQWEYAYDAAGNALSATNRQRFHDDTEITRPLGNVTTNPKARVSYQASWPDAIGRTRVSADYGTCGAGVFVRPEVAPERSAVVLVSSIRYGGDGQAAAQIDAQGVETRWRNDAAGRRILLLEGCEAGLPKDRGEAPLKRGHISIFNILV